MGVLLSTVIPMSIAASLTALAVMVVRLAMGKVVPRVVFYALWGVVVFQMVSPFSIRSPFSLEQLLPLRQVFMMQAAERFAEEVTPEALLGNAYLDMPKEYFAKDWLNEEEAEAYLYLEELEMAAATNRIAESSWWSRNGAALLTGIWLMGGALVLGRSFYQSRRLSKRCETATLFADKELLAECVFLSGLSRSVPVYVTEQAESPFVTGVLRSKVIIPSVLLKEEPDHLKWVLLHEFSHVKRRDPAVKLLAFVALAVHWFNPVLWGAFFLMERDMEMSCDERVLTLTSENTREKAVKNRHSYATSLLRMAVEGEGYARGALTFAESNISRRIKNITAFKKPSRPVKTVSAIFAVVLVLALLPQASMAGDGFYLAASTMTGKASLPGSILVLGQDENGVTDTIMIVSQTKGGQVCATHIPRDTEVAPDSGKINFYAYENGAEALKEYLESLWDIQLDHYVVVRHAMVEDVVDAAGGVEFDNPIRMYYSDPYATPPLLIDIPEGFQVLNGEQFTHVARYRMGYMNGDSGRIDFQRQLLTAVSEQRERLAGNISGVEIADILSKHSVETSMSFGEVMMAAGTVLESGVEILAIEEVPVAVVEPPYIVWLDEDSREEVFTYMGLR